MAWSYRIVKVNYPKLGERFEVREVYYTESGNIAMCTAQPEDLSADSKEDLLAMIEQIAEAKDMPVLDIAELKKSISAPKVIIKG